MHHLEFVGREVETRVVEIRCESLAVELGHVARGELPLGELGRDLGGLGQRACQVSRRLRRLQVGVRDRDVANQGERCVGDLHHGLLQLRLREATLSRNQKRREQALRERQSAAESIARGGVDHVDAQRRVGEQARLHEVRLRNAQALERHAEFAVVEHRDLDRALLREWLCQQRVDSLSNLGATIVLVLGLGRDHRVGSTPVGDHFGDV